MSCCHFSEFMSDFNYYWPMYHVSPPTEAQLKSAKADWRAGNTGYEGVRNALHRAADAFAKSNEVLVHMGGNNYKVSTKKKEKS